MPYTAHPSAPAFRTLALSLGLTWALAATPSLVQAATLSPLATPDQLSLDQRATQINQTDRFPATRAQAKATFLLAHGLLPAASGEALARLDQDIDELVFSAIQKAVNADPLYPKVYWVNAPTRQWFGTSVPGGRYSYDNPDNIYRTIPIEGGSRYVVHGRRVGQGPTDVTFSLISDVNSQNTINVLAGPDLVVGADGRFDITIDDQPANGRINHIQSTSKAKQLFVRNNLGDWNTEVPDSLTVERLDGTPSRAPRGDLAVSAEAWSNLQASILDYGVGALGLKTHTHAVNTLANPSTSSTLGTLVTQASSFGHYRLQDDEALVATLKTGGAGYFVFPVTDAWLVSVDPIGHQTSLNNKQAVANADGSYTFVLSIKDPGVHNWIDPVGQNEGTFMVRWQNLPQTTVDGGPQISATVVKLSALSKVLPTGTRLVTADERARILAARVAGYQRRIGFID